MQRKGDQSHHDDHRCEDRDDVTVAPLARASSGPFVAHGWLLVPLNRAHPCLGSERGATSGPGSRSRLWSSRSKSAIRWGMVLGTSDRAASSRATAVWISLIIRCLRADCRVSPVPCLRAMRAPRLFQMAREWMQAMMAEEDDASTIPKRKPPPARTVSPHPAAPERREDA
jgi:hypothetical protein